MEIPAQFPTPLQVLFQPKRYKVLYGGRSAGRSWGISRALLLIGTKRPTRNLCVRELQNSMRESVHKVLADQVVRLGLTNFYDVQADRIIGRHENNLVTEFNFEGIKNNTSKVRSYEGIDYCWAEEAVKISRASWKILIPTIRKEICPNGHALPPVTFTAESDDENADFAEEEDIYVCKICGATIVQSEIWMSFNPELEKDYTYKRFVTNANPKNSFVIKMTWRDNPWFSRVSHAEMLEDKKEDYDTYLNVWEGFCVQVLEGAVFAKELRQAQKENRICPVAWSRETPVDTFWDLGRRDMTSIWFAQRVAMQWRILDYYENSGYDITHYLKYCQNKPYVYGTAYMPHDAAHKRIGEKRSVEQIAREMGFYVLVVQRAHKKVNPINAARIILPSCYFDEDKCAPGLDRLRHYKYQVIDGQTSSEPLHDDNSNAADAFMTLGQSIKSPRKKSDLMEKMRADAREKAKSRLNDSNSSLDWMRQ